MEKTPEKLIVSAALMAEIVGLAPHYINELVREKGAPRENKAGKYNVTDFVLWYLDYKREEYEAKLKKIQEGKSQDRLNTANAEIKELQLKQMQGELMPSDQVRLAFGELKLIFQKGLEAMPTRLAPILAGVTREEAQQLIQKETDNILKQIANVSLDQYSTTTSDSD
jgi:ribosomal protein L31E